MSGKISNNFNLRYLSIHQLTILLIFFIIFTLVLFAAFSLGSFDFSIISLLFGDTTQIENTIFYEIRIPRVILASLVGASLAISGACLQGLFRNPLVDPGFIGISSGAAIGAMISIMFGSSIYYFMPQVLIPFALPILAMTGSFLATTMVYKMSKVSGKTNIMAMLLSGIAINAFAGAIIGLFVSLSSDAELRSFTFWTLGGLDMADWDIVAITFLFIIIPFIIIYKSQYQMDIFMLGDAESEHLGINVEKLKKKIILISSITVGVSVAFCGMIGFVGLVTPHLVRLFIGPNHKYLIPGSAILGALILTISDLICKTIIAPAQLPIGVVTSTIGAPFFIWLILNQKSRFNYAE